MGCFDSGGSEQQAQSRSTLPEQDQLMREFIELYGPQLGINENVWQGERVVPFTDLQQGALTGAQNFSDYFTTPQTARNPLLDQTISTTGEFLAGTRGAQPMSRQNVGDYFTETVREPATRRFREETIPGIAEDYAGPGFFGSARSHEQSEARTDLTEGLRAEESELQYLNLLRNQQLEEASADRALAAIPQALQVGRAPAVEIQDNLNIAAQQIGGLNALFGIGQAEQTQEQAELQAEIIKFGEENNITDPQNLAILMALMQISFQSSSSSGSSWGPGLGYVGASSFLSSMGGEAGGNLGGQMFRPQ